jgi:hypothetical protein
MNLRTHARTYIHRHCYSRQMSVIGTRGCRCLHWTACYVPRCGRLNRRQASGFWRRRQQRSGWYRNNRASSINRQRPLERSYSNGECKAAIEFRFWKWGSLPGEVAVGENRALGTSSGGRERKRGKRGVRIPRRWRPNSTQIGLNNSNNLCVLNFGIYYKA